MRDSPSVRWLVVNADDFGLSRGVSDGIAEAHTRGIVTSASLMVNRPAAEYAPELASANPGLSVGLHFEGDGEHDLDEPGQAAEAFSLQLCRFRELIGSSPTHVDSHHHAHAAKDRLATFSKLVAPLGVPLRHDGRVRYIGAFWAQREEGVTELDYVRRPFLLELIGNEAVEGFTELACHPARLTGDFNSSYLEEREVELRTLTEAGLAEQIEASGVKLVSFAAWPG